MLYSTGGQWQTKSYPTAQQQSQRMGTALSSSIHSAGMANKAPSLPYTRSSAGASLSPTGGPYKQNWGELTRQNVPGRDIWGGKEISGLKYGGGPAQRSDYWHQMTEQTPKMATSSQTSASPKVGGPLTTITGQGSVPGGGSGGWSLGKQMR